MKAIVLENRSIAIISPPLAAYFNNNLLYITGKQNGLTHPVISDTGFVRGRKYDNEE